MLLESLLRGHLLVVSAFCNIYPFMQFLMFIYNHNGLIRLQTTVETGHGQWISIQKQLLSKPLAYSDGVR